MDTNLKNNKKNPEEQKTTNKSLLGNFTVTEEKPLKNNTHTVIIKKKVIKRKAIKNLL